MTCPSREKCVSNKKSYGKKSKIPLSSGIRENRPQTLTFAKNFFVKFLLDVNKLFLKFVSLAVRPLIWPVYVCGSWVTEHILQLSVAEWKDR